MAPRVRWGRIAARCAGLALCLFGAGLLAAGPPRSVHGAGEHVLLATLKGEIDPITDAYVGRAVDQATRDGANALIIALDTPGGLDTSMRSINQRILSAPLPVVVYVSPSGARAASAGLFVTEAADIAAMAPGTNIGSAHPADIGGANLAPQASATPGAANQDVLSQKVENDAVAYIRALATLHQHNADWAEQAVRQSVNVPADVAVQLKVVDLQSRDLGTLLTALDGKQVVKQGHTYSLHTAGAAVERIDLAGFDSLLQTAADPTVAYLLLLLAIVTIGVWIAHPGLVVPGVVGAVAAILAFMSFANLPVTLAGILLIVLAIALFVVDIKAPTHGALTVGGIIAMALGGMLLIDTGMLDEGVNRGVIFGTTLALAACFGYVVRKVVAARHRPVAIGPEELVGATGTVREALAPEGLVFVDGALWRARFRAGMLEPGASVRVVRIDGLTLQVEPAGITATAAGDEVSRRTPNGLRRWSLKRRTSWLPH